MSAFLPTSREPVKWSSRSTCAPPIVAMARASRAGTAVGLEENPLGSRAVRRISSNMSWLLLLAGPSVPMARRMPSSDMRTTSATPLASFRLLVGL